MATATTTAAAKPVEEVAHLLTRTVCLMLQCGSLGNSRRVELSTYDMEKDGEKLTAERKRELRAHRPLFSSGDLAPCARVLDALKTALRAQSVDGGTRIFGPGAYLVPLLGVERAEETIARATADLAEQVELLVAKLPDLKAKRKEELGPLYREEDYPDADRVRAAYRIRHNYVRFGAPDHLEEVSAAAYARAVATHDAAMREAAADVVQGLRQSAALVMRQLAVKLGADEEGKARALRPAALRDLNELLDRLPILNSVAEDTELSRLLGRVAAVAQGIEVETLRSAPAVRAMLLKEAEAAAEGLEALVTSGERAICFEGM